MTATFATPFGVAFIAATKAGSSKTAMSYQLRHAFRRGLHCGLKFISFGLRLDALLRHAFRRGLHCGPDGSINIRPSPPADFATPFGVAFIAAPCLCLAILPFLPSPRLSAWPSLRPRGLGVRGVFVGDTTFATPFGVAFIAAAAPASDLGGIVRFATPFGVAFIAAGQRAGSRDNAEHDFATPFGVAFIAAVVPAVVCLVMIASSPRLSAWPSLRQFG